MDLITGTSFLAARPAAEALSAAAAARLLGAAAAGDGEACHALGVAYSTAPREARDLVEAHKWFNLGALYGHQEAGWSRADIAAEMSRGEIAEAQRRAREWLGAEMRRAA